MVVQIAVCDDEIIFLEDMVNQIATQFRKSGSEININSFMDGTNLLEENSNIPFDVLFLDIEMPGISGIEVAETIRASNPFVIIIFITNRDDLVFHSLRYRPFRFIRKTHLREELPEAIEAIVKKLRSENQYITVSFNNSSTQIRITEIMYVESYKHDIFLYIQDEKYRIKSNLKIMEKELEGYGFIRVHSGFLVNYRYIFSIDKTKVILNNKEMVPLSRYRSEAVKQKLQLFSRGTQ
ncbi:LytTR family DNA-binding domain-containing protein [Anaerocolumna sp. AGMB13025]|uniref:LytR/AlgR family response regulator transcription factor n=1 Tax=Anaerocolumna sp. AGMB13025 TaxID=3039116 RepID=UPI00241F3A41|nr:LytTR family DNA-binding domain-containing protein [Anaerocolumna sp. AGMB13025]WFR57542.1 LytTR family DNA-binding domain-containing protein [Anaerocolumna sp. AGMB13025]